MHLVVTAPFAAHSRGDVISDPAAVEAALAEHSQDVVRVEAPVEAPVAPEQKG